jgi:hypothetical protein
MMSVHRLSRKRDSETVRDRERERERERERRQVCFFDVYLPLIRKRTTSGKS